MWDGYFRILGRLSVDIIKSGGCRLSALGIEAPLLDDPSIAECAVVGVTDDVWGETVGMAVVLGPALVLDLDALRVWCRVSISTYKIPKEIRVVESLPRNTKGKVAKPAVTALFH